MESIGEYVKSIREEHNLSIDELAKETMIKKEHLELLEDNQVDKLGGFGVVKSYAYTIVRKLNIDQRKLISIINNKYPQYKVDNFQALEYKQENKFLISANYIYALILIIITTFLVIYVVNMIKNDEITIFKARNEIKESKVNDEVEEDLEKILIELPPPSERNK